MARRGFRPARAERGRRMTFVLGRCPFAKGRRHRSGHDLRLHLGLARGLGGLAVERPAARDARRASCRLTVRRVAAPAGVTA